MYCCCPAKVFLQTEDHMKTCTYSSDGVQERGAVEEQAWVTEMAKAGQVAGALTPLSAWCQLPAQQLRFRGRGSSAGKKNQSDFTVHG